MRVSPTRSFADLLSDSYLSKWRQSAPAPLFDRQAPLVVVHVPKTAGTSFAHGIFRAFRSPYSVPWDDIEGGFNRFLANYGRHEAANGHIDHRHVRASIAHPKPFSVATFIRHPVDRAISNYTYCCSEKHPTHENFRKAFPTIDRYVDWGGMTNNYLAKTLVGDVASPQQFIDVAMTMYDFIGVSELYNVSSMLFGLAWGVPFEPPAAKINAAEQRAAQDVEITPNALERLHAVNDIDLPFYEFVLGLYRQQLENLVTVALRS